VRILAILNPAAGGGTAPGISRRIRAEVPVTREWDWAIAERRGHATELARAAAVQHGFDRVVVVGGDGTVYEVANGLAHSDTELAIIPAGTANDVVRNLGIPREPAAAATLAATGAARAIDLGEAWLDGSMTSFVNSAGIGFDAEVAWRVNRSSKVLGGTLPYLAGVVRTLWHYASPWLRISIDGRHIETRVFLLVVGNCPAYGGGMRIVPDARPDDGVFDVCLVHSLSRLEVLRLIPRLYSGSHVSHPAVELFRCTTVEVSAASDGGSGRVLCQADGELVGEVPVRFAIRPGALRCVTGPTPGSVS
jgi:YegS/Rv2252/BmrU family lipid kinase